jgi:hypothetical protein
MSTVSSATEHERLLISVAIRSLLTAAVTRSVSGRYGFTIGSLCAGLSWDAHAAHPSVEQGRANELWTRRAEPDALILGDPRVPFVDDAPP